MAVTTTMSLNPETTKIINYMLWQRTIKQRVWEYFWLRQEAVYDDNWENVIDYINDFKDLQVLKQKEVKYTQRLSDLWVTEEEFNKLFINWLPDYGEWEQSDTWSTTKTKKK